MEGQLVELIRSKIIDAQAAPIPSFTLRDVRVPGVAGKAIAVIGMRRAGKTTFLWQLLADRIAAGMEREGLLYFNFEDERLAEMKVSDLQVVVEEFYRLSPAWRDKRRAVFMLDEIQVISGWETFARRLLDTENIELFVSGSSAKLLSREVATSMRGRAMEARVYPFSFREYLRHRGREPNVPARRVGKALRSALQKDLKDYLAEGGFPEAQGVELRDRMELLRSHVDTVLLRDIIERHEVSHPVALRWMIRHLLGNAAGSFSINKFYGDLKSQGMAIAKDTLHAYLEYIEDSFLVRTVSIASDSERRRMVNPRKVYPVDTGLIPVFDRSARGNLGHALETAVLWELARRGAEISYVRTPSEFEVDFCAHFHDGRQWLVQACAELSDSVTREREVRALHEASKSYPDAKLHLVTLAPETAREISAPVTVHDASTWLLWE